MVTKSDANSDAIISDDVESNTRGQEGERLRHQRHPGAFAASPRDTVQVGREEAAAMRIWIDPARFVAFTTPLDIQNALDRENVEPPAGKPARLPSSPQKTRGKLVTVDDFQHASSSHRRANARCGCVMGRGALGSGERRRC